MDMAVLVDAQGEMLDNIETQVTRNLLYSYIKSKKMMHAFDFVWSNPILRKFLTDITSTLSLTLIYMYPFY